ncbi:MAG: trypsin-like peptidase domain-containing protein, partial [Oscillospiraceae bacterium]|nr:trypsin-like peptidase domain-containing protein [Oscillospiraceae bacterium]
ILLCLSMLGGISFWAVSRIAALIAETEQDRPAQDRPARDPSPRVSQSAPAKSDWTSDDLPWGKPDPSVSLSVQPAGAALSPKQIYQEALPSLVVIEAAHKPEGPRRTQGYSMGTGVIVTASGYVLTNYHIIDEAVSIQLRLLSDTNDAYDALVIGFDEEFDIAVLKFDPDGAKLTPAQLGDSDKLMVGDWVYAIGNPMGYLLGSMSVGIVSALNRDEDESGGALGLIQTDAVLNPGNSGGALLNESGQVVGITCAKITGVVREDGEAIDDAVVLEGMGLAIPMSDAIPFVNHIRATGESGRPTMGILCFAATVDGRQGIQVSDVTGEAARAAGLKKNDLILSANGSPVTSLVELRRVLYRTGVDGELTCTVLRGGQELEISFRLVDGSEQD